MRCGRPRSAYREVGLPDCLALSDYLANDGRQRPQGALVGRKEDLTLVYFPRLEDAVGNEVFNGAPVGVDGAPGDAPGSGNGADGDIAVAHHEIADRLLDVYSGSFYAWISQSAPASRGLDERHDIRTNVEQCVCESGVKAEAESSSAYAPSPV